MISSSFEELIIVCPRNDYDIDQAYEKSKKYVINQEKKQVSKPYFFLI